MTRRAFENAIRVNGAIGGSTMRSSIDTPSPAGSASTSQFGRLGRGVPTIVDLMPSGRFLMEDFSCRRTFAPSWRASPGPAACNLDQLTVSGETIGEICKGAANYNAEVIRPLDNPLTPEGGIAVLRGNLAPDGAILKPSAASPKLMKHKGRAVVFGMHRGLSRPRGRSEARHRRELRSWC